MGLHADWRILNFKGHDPYRNLASEEAIFMSVNAGLSPNTISFYINDKTAVLGCFQSVEKEINPFSCKKDNVKILRRITGGGCVFHDLGNLNYSIIIKKTRPYISRGLLATSHRLMHPIIELIKNLKIDPILEENSIFINDKKIGGLACAIKRRAFLLHGTLLVNSQLDLIDQVLKLDTFSNDKSFERKSTPSNKKKITTLSIELGGRVSMVELKEKMKTVFERFYDVEIPDGSLNEYEINLLDGLMRNKYLRHEWNFKM